jgi:hypothetical protein
MLGSALSAQPYVVPGVQGLHARDSTSSCCSHVLVDMQLGRAELQRWPVPQGTSLPSGPGREGSQDCLWGLRFSTHSSCCFFPVAAMRLHLLSLSSVIPFLCSLSKSQAQATTWSRKHASNGRPQPRWPVHLPPVLWAFWQVRGHTSPAWANFCLKFLAFALSSSSVWVFVLLNSLVKTSLC